MQALAVDVHRCWVLYIRGAGIGYLQATFIAFLLVPMTTTMPRCPLNVSTGMTRRMWLTLRPQSSAPYPHPLWLRADGRPRSRSAWMAYAPDILLSC